MSHLNIWIFGVSGRMGEELVKVFKKDPKQFELLGGSEQGTPEKKTVEGLKKSDIIIDFSGAKGNEQLQDMMVQYHLKNKFILIGSTGLDDHVETNWQKLATAQSLGILKAPNTSLGIYLTVQAALNISKQCTKHDFDIEIEESHHKFKKDSPSGTAVDIANQIAESTQYKPVYQRSGVRQENEIGVHATRGGGIFGEHKIRFMSQDEEIQITHRAFSRSLFAKGAAVLVQWLIQQDYGYYTTQDVQL